MSLRRRAIDLAASLPAGSPERKAVLAVVIKSAEDDVDTGWSTMLRMKKFVDEEIAPAENYKRQVALLRSLQAGDKVEITYNDPQRGGKTKTVRTVTHSWDDVKSGGGGSRVTVLLAQKGVQRPGAVKGGMISDYGSDTGVVWQASMQMPVKGIVDLRRV